MLGPMLGRRGQRAGPPPESQPRLRRPDWQPSRTRSPRMSLSPTSGSRACRTPHAAPSHPMRPSTVSCARGSRNTSSDHPLACARGHVASLAAAAADDDPRRARRRRCGGGGCGARRAAGEHRRAVATRAEERSGDDHGAGVPGAQRRARRACGGPRPRAAAIPARAPRARPRALDDEEGGELVPDRKGDRNLPFLLVVLVQIITAESPAWAAPRAVSNGPALWRSETM